MTQLTENSFQLSEQIEVRFVEAESTDNLAQLKPRFATELLRELPEGAKVYYFDPDIVVLAPWSLFDGWAKFGFAVCQEITLTELTEHHVLTCMWSEWAKGHGLDLARPVSRYYNSGFFALTSAQSTVLRNWSKVIALANRDGYSGSKVRTVESSAERWNCFTTWDQDALNIALRMSNDSLCDAGPEAMGFRYGGAFMAHAAGGVKPWNKRYMLSALRGHAPTFAEKTWFQFVESPVPAMSYFDRLKLRLSITGAAVIGKFIA